MIRIAKPILILLLLIISSTAIAVDYRAGGGFRIGLFSYNEDQLEALKLSWGGQGRLLIGDYFAGEFSIQHRQDSVSTQLSDLEITTYPIHFSVLVYPFRIRTVSPYVVAGLGWYKLEVSGEVDVGPVVIRDTVSLSESGPHIGAGLEIFIGRHFSSGFDVRKLFFEFETPFGDLSADFLKYAYLLNIYTNFYF